MSTGILVEVSVGEGLEALCDTGAVLSQTAVNDVNRRGDPAVHQFRRSPPRPPRNTSTFCLGALGVLRGERQTETGRRLSCGSSLTRGARLGGTARCASTVSPAASPVDRDSAPSRRQPRRSDAIAQGPRAARPVQLRNEYLYTRTHTRATLSRVAIRSTTARPRK